jgi:hypothetical protein
MKNKKTLLYDDACPLCACYTGAFVKTGLLAKEGRKAYSTVSPEILKYIDQKRGVNEIPLIDHETNEVLYGIDALVSIIGQRCPFVRVLGKKESVKWPLKKLYNFISYNRKVIVARNSVAGTIDCTPDFNIFYRLLFMSVFFLFNTLMLFPVHEALVSKIPFFDITLFEFHAAHIGIVCINVLMTGSLTKREAIEYLGQVNMLSLVTILLLTPLMFLNKWWPQLDFINYPYLFLLTIFIVREYFRRMKFAGITTSHKNIVAINLLSIAGFIASLFVL